MPLSRPPALAFLLVDVPQENSRDNGRSLLAGDGRQLGPLQREVDEGLQGHLGVLGELVLRILLDVHAHGRADRARAGQAEDDARAVLHDEADALLLGDAAVVRVAVLELVGLLELVLGVGLVLHDLEVLVRDLLAHGVEEGVAGLLGAPLVVVAGVVVAAVLLPVGLDDVGDAHELALFGGLVRLGEDREPGQHGPDSVLLADVVGPGPEGFLAADGELPGVHEVSEVLPPGGHLVELDVLGLRDEVHGPAGGHGPGATLEALLEVRDALLGLVDDDGQGVGRGDEELLAEDHVAVGVAVSRGAELRHLGVVDRVLAETHDLDEVFRVREVGVRVSSTEVLLRLGVEADGLLVHAQLLGEDPLREGSSDAVHGVVDHGEVRARGELLDGLEIEDLLHLVRVHADGIDHLDVHVSELVEGHLVKVDRRDLRGDAVLLDLLGDLEDLLGHVGDRRPTVGAVVLDTEVLLRASRVVRGGEDDATERLHVADERRHAGSGHQVALGDNHLADTVRGGHAHDDGAGLVVVVPAIATEHEGLPLQFRAKGVEDGLDEVLEVALVLEVDLGLLTKAGGTRLLVFVGGGFHLLDSELVK
mmetsp:Transcript_1872/g.3603  ORF Transcript_1872/g.3603 Transcript_1872/m.3603 type:complete len:592 (+) Transcript_1872:280-2055(+)